MLNGNGKHAINGNGKHAINGNGKHAINGNGKHAINGKHTMPVIVSGHPQVTTQAIRWARQAGQIAMRYFRNVAVSYKQDNSLVTQADVEIEQYLMNKIRQAYPTHRFIGEEAMQSNGVNINRPLDSLPQTPYTWAIDPLDGTTAFVHGLPGWGISLGLLFYGQPIFGLFYMPLLDDLTYTTNDGIICNGQYLHHSVQPDWGRKGFMAVSAGTHHDFELDILRMRALGSVSSSFVYTARGSAAAALIPKAYLWDLIAGACILNKAGGELRYISGKPVDFHALLNGQRAPEPILAGHPNMLAELQTAIKPRVTVM
jgi:myo-inositol-1(or 4)-monophosphatase